MPRQPRLEAPGLLYHIIARGIEKSEIFKDDSDCHAFLDRLGKVLTDTGTKCFAFCLISNHFHLLMRSSSIPVSSVMRRLLTGYALYFNKKYRRAGHLFQNRYKSIICEEDAYLLELIRYIHLNPVRAGIVKTPGDLGDYPFSGHSALLGRMSYNWYDSLEVLYHFGNNKKRAVKKYLEFLSDGLAMGKDPRFGGGGLRRSLSFPSNFPKEKQASDDRILGSSDYVLALQALTDKGSDEISHENVGDIIKKVAKSHKLTPTQILGRSKTPKLSKARAEIAHTAVTKIGLSFAEAGRHLNLNRSTVARLVAKEGQAADNEKG